MPDLETVEPTQFAVGPSQIIRSVLNRRLGSTSGYDQDAREKQNAERECLVSFILRLYQTGIMHSNMPVRDGDVERAAAILRRLQIMGRRDFGQIVTYAEQAAAKEKNQRALIVDPLQLRHLLAFHDDIPHEEMTQFEIFRLRDACEKRDKEGLRNWFTTTGAKKNLLPKDTPAFLKFMLLEQWNAGNTDLAEFAFEAAVLDVRFYGPIGWENTRLFYSILKNIAGKDCNLFNEYLNAEDLEEAIGFHAKMADKSHVDHFKTLKTQLRPETLAQLEQEIFRVANEREKTPNGAPKGPPPTNRGSKSSWGWVKNISKVFGGNPA